MTYRLSCHCGAVQIDLNVADLGTPYRCDCSLCRRKGAAIAAVARDALTIVQGTQNLTLYQWNTKVAEHYFCKTCGIYTHHKRRVDPATFGVNTGAIDGFVAAEIGEVSGRNHPSD